MPTDPNPGRTHYDFVIVGSGAGGGPLAADLALAGFDVVVIEAGGDEVDASLTTPAFHPLSTEHPERSWEFFVKPYSDPATIPNGKEYPPIPARGGGTSTDPRHQHSIFYPRAAGLGGCTTHHALITVRPHDSDWNDIERLTGDSSWNADNMRQYFDRIEDPSYPTDVSALFLNTINAGADLFLGAIRGLASLFRDDSTPQRSRNEQFAWPWLPVTQANPRTVANDLTGIGRLLVHSLKAAKGRGLDLMNDLNPNHPSAADNANNDAGQGINLIPISVDDKGQRVGARERILLAQRLCTERRQRGEKAGQLDIALHTFAKQLIFDATASVGAEPVARGVACVQGRHLYGATHHSLPLGNAGQAIDYTARHEVILCGGAYNSPQLLMLSGIGPRADLEALGITVRVDQDAVGRNLQDRYEVGVVAEMEAEFGLLDGAEFDVNDDVYKEYQRDGDGLYATNGALIGFIQRSSTRGPNDPSDLYLFGAPTDFHGYHVGYSDAALHPPKWNHFTWVVLKGHTDNRSGQVSLASADPFETPNIEFHYFDDSAQNAEDDLKSLNEGVDLALAFNARLRDKGMLKRQLRPAPGEDTDEFIKKQAWGHHASCTCAIGSVLDSKFRVNGVQGLRVVDASVFPRIPGLYILAAVYMISGKASDDLITEYSASTK